MSLISCVFCLRCQALPHGILGPVTAASAANEGEVKKNRFKDISPCMSNARTLQNLVQSFTAFSFGGVR